jgi:hypothetical protein
LNHGQTIWEKKCGVIANLFRNTLGTSGTSWELGWNTFGIEPNKYFSTPSSGAKPKRGGKKNEASLSLLFGHVKFLLSKQFVTIFNLD